MLEKSFHFWPFTRVTQRCKSIMLPWNPVISETDRADCPYSDLLEYLRQAEPSTLSTSLIQRDAHFFAFGNSDKR